MYLDNLLPGIILKWPEWWPKKVRVQLDNAPAHPIAGKLGAKIDARLAEMSAGGWDISFIHQPAKSPDCNTLDLAFFRAIQSLQYQKSPTNIDELIAHVHEAFAELPLDICCKVWTTAQIVMNQILIKNGNNNYKLKHIGKLKIEKAVSSKISMRLPCRALIDGGALDSQYITTFMSNGKFIVVFTASRCRRCRPSLSIAPSLLPSPPSVTLLPSPTTTSSSIRVIAVAVAVRHRRRCPSASSASP
jgi:hypothetical protein